MDVMILCGVGELMESILLFNIRMGEDACSGINGEDSNMKGLIAAIGKEMLSLSVFGVA